MTRDDYRARVQIGRIRYRFACWLLDPTPQEYHRAERMRRRALRAAAARHRERLARIRWREEIRDIFE